MDLGAVAPLGADEAAAGVTDPAHRRQVLEMMVLLEACRHPLTDDQMTRVETYAAALHESDAGMTVARSLLARGAPRRWRTTGREIALGAMKLGVSDTDAHWVEFLGNLAVHEAGFFNQDDFVGKTATLAREGAGAMLSEGFLRGSRCTGDFTTIDRLALAVVPLDDIRHDSASHRVPNVSESRKPGWRSASRVRSWPGISRDFASVVRTGGVQEREASKNGSPRLPGSTPALVAQRIEHLTTDQKVGGSNPSERAASPQVRGTFRKALASPTGSVRSI